MSLDLTKLTNVKRLPDGSITAGCPACMAENHDKTRSHLWVHKSGAYKCAKHQDDPDHSLAIYRAVAGDPSTESYEYHDPQPKLTVDKVFPEDSLIKLVPEYGYWLGRGVKADVLSRLGGGVAIDSDRGKLSSRWVFPCRDNNNQLIGFAGRTLEEYTFAPKWKIIGPKNKFIFPHVSIAREKISKKDQIILVEGIGCSLALANQGLWNSLCLFGINISSSQMCYLISVGITDIIISTNNEESGVGNRAATKLKSKLSRFFNEDRINIHLPLQKDFLEMKQEEIQEWRKYI